MAKEAPRPRVAPIMRILGIVFGDRCLEVGEIGIFGGEVWGRKVGI